MAVELKKQLDKGEEMRRTKDESIKALQGDFLSQSVLFKSFIHKLRTYAAIGHFELYRNKRTNPRLGGQICIFRSFYKGNCKLVLSASSMFFCMYIIRNRPIQAMCRDASFFTATSLPLLP